MRREKEGHRSADKDTWAATETGATTSRDGQILNRPTGLQTAAYRQPQEETIERGQGAERTRRIERNRHRGNNGRSCHGLMIGLLGFHRKSWHGMCSENSLAWITEACSYGFSRCQHNWRSSLQVRLRKGNPTRPVRCF